MTLTNCAEFFVGKTNNHNGTIQRIASDGLRMNGDNGTMVSDATPKQAFIVRVFDLLNFENEGKIRQ